MAKSTGKFSALSQLQPLQGDIATDILNREDQQFKHREEKRITDALTKKEVDELAAKRKKEAEDYASGLDEINLKDSGVRSYDERNIDVYTRKGGILDTYNELSKRLEKDPADKEAIVGIKNLKNFATDINEISQGLLTHRKNIGEGVASGLFSETLNKDDEQKIDGMINEKNYRWDIGKDFSVNLINEGYDKNKDGKFDDADKLTKQDIINLNQLGGIKKFDAKTFATETKQNYGTLTKKTDGTEYVGFNMTKLENLKSEIDARMGADLASMTNDGKSLASDWNKIDYNTLTQTEFTRLKDNLAQKVIDSYNTTDNKTTDWQGVNANLARDKFNYEKSQNAKAEVSKDQGGIDGFSPATDEKGNVLKGNGTKRDLWEDGWSPRMTTGGGAIFTTNPNNEKSMLYGKNYLTLEQAEINEDGEMTVTGIESVLDTEKNQWANTRVTITDPTEINLIAQSKGFKNYQEFSQALLKKKNGKKDGGKEASGGFNAESFYNNYKSGK